MSRQRIGVDILIIAKLLRLFLVIFFVTAAVPVLAEETPLPVDQVFQASVTPQDAKTVAIHWNIRPGYYLYQEKIKIESPSTPISSVDLPAGLPRHNQFMGNYHVYEKPITGLIHFDSIPHALTLIVHYQGCAAAGFCYPPVKKVFNLQLNPKQAAATPSKLESNKITNSDQGKAMQLLVKHNVWLILIGFFGFGLLLSLTPCVLPLIPVLSAIILGQKQLTTWKAFTLALTYVLAMALTYALAGVFAGLAGGYLQAILQSPWVIIVVSLIFVLLAFSLFGFYDLKLPNSWHEKLTHLTNRQQGGNYLGVAAMGCLSTLVISPCITAPLVGVLTYISNTGNAVLGGFALFILGLGSGVPLLIIGTSAGKWLPKSGPWMNWVKIILGIMMLIMAAWLVLRIIPTSSFHFLNNSQALSINSEKYSIKKIEDLDQAFIKAKTENKPLLLIYTANWCISCKEMESTVFTRPEVKALLKHFVLVFANVTTNDAKTKALESKYKVIAPPTFVFFNAKGEELSSFRLVGQQSAQAFVTHLQQVLKY